MYNILRGITNHEVPDWSYTSFNTMFNKLYYKCCILIAWFCIILLSIIILKNKEVVCVQYIAWNYKSRSCSRLNVHQFDTMFNKTWPQVLYFESIVLYYIVKSLHISLIYVLHFNRNLIMYQLIFCVKGQLTETIDGSTGVFN